MKTVNTNTSFYLKSKASVAPPHLSSSTSNLSAVNQRKIDRIPKLQNLEMDSVNMERTQASKFKVQKSMAARLSLSTYSKFQRTRSQNNENLLPTVEHPVPKLKIDYTKFDNCKDQTASKSNKNIRRINSPSMRNSMQLTSSRNTINATQVEKKRRNKSHSSKVSICSQTQENLGVSLPVKKISFSTIMRDLEEDFSRAKFIKRLTSSLNPSIIITQRPEIKDVLTSSEFRLKVPVSSSEREKSRNLIKILQTKQNGSSCEFLNSFIKEFVDKNKNKFKTERETQEGKVQKKFKPNAISLIMRPKSPKVECFGVKAEIQLLKRDVRRSIEKQYKETRVNTFLKRFADEIAPKEEIPDDDDDQKQTEAVVD